MNESQAYQLVVDAMNLATTKGVFNLQDVSNILAALDTLRPKETPQGPAGIPAEAKTEQPK